MTDRPDHFDRDDAGGLPHDLSARLRDATAPPPLPDRVGRTISLAAADRFGTGASRRRRIGWIGGGIAAAAAIALAAVLWPTPVRPPVAHVAPPDPRDVNADGRVDILDAFALARAVEARKSVPGPDLNNDGIVDAHDADLLALAAVDLEPRRATP